jgi:hypothetical protein
VSLLPNADHIDGNGLNNTRANLRLCSHSENIRNQRLRVSDVKRSRFKGVTFYPDTGRWKAVIHHNKVRYSLGIFEIEEEAARAYDAAARERFGEFARTNEDMGLFLKAA